MCVGGGKEMKAILIDDEPLALTYLERQIDKIGGINIIDTFVWFNIDDHKQLLNDINIVFLDIEMPETNGLEMAEKIIEINPYLEVIFVTAYNNYAVQAFELNALDYILKPVQIDRLQETVNRLVNKFDLVKNINERQSEKLKINVCNELVFELDDELSIVNWRTAKAKELFAYLLLHEGKLIHKEDLVEIFWQEIKSERAFPLLYTTVYHIRKAISGFNEFLTLKNKQDGYILITNNILIDLVEWERKVDNYYPVNENNIEHLEEVMALYTNSYLNKLDYMWADTERFRLENKWITTAQNISNYYYKNGIPKQAESWLINICQVQPENENAHFLLMKLYDSLGYGILVNHQYEKLSKSLNDLGLTVNAQIKNWYEKWETNQA